MEPTQAPDPAPTPEPTNPPPSPAPQPVIIQPSVVKPDVSPAPAMPSQPVVPPTPTTPSFAPAGPIVGGDDMATTPVSSTFGSTTSDPAADSSPIRSFNSGKPPKSKRKKLMVVAGSLAAVLVIASGAVFGLYLPNTPDHAFNTGLSHTGQALTKLTDQATEQKHLNAYEQSVITGSLTATSDGATYSGDLSASYDKTKLNSALNVSFQPKDQAAKTLSAKLLADTPTGSTYPNIYFQLSGLQAVGLSDLVPSIAGYDGKWISVDADYLKSLGSSLGADASTTAAKQPSAADVAALVKTVVETTNQYVFTADSSKAVLTKKSYVGKEKVEGISAYHYKVSVNVAHAKDYCAALASNVLSNKVYQNLTGMSADKVASQKQSAAKNCQDSDISSLGKQSFDMWIGGKYRLVHKIRVSDSTTPDNYTEFGQNYSGGDVLSLFIKAHQSTTDTAFTVNTNLKTSVTDGNLTVTDGSGQTATNLKANFKVTPSSKPVDVTKPADSVPLQDVLKAFGVDPAMLIGTYNGISQKANDTLAQTNLRVLQSHLETVFATKGFYPTLSQIEQC